MSGDEYEDGPSWVADLLEWLRFALEMVVALAVGLIVWYGIEALFDGFAR